MSENYLDVAIEVPRDVLEKCSGFAVDIGGSAVKIIYRTKSEWEALQKDKTAEKGTLQCLTCSRPNLIDAMKSIQSKASVLDDSKVYSCGLGGHEFKQEIKEVLGRDVENVDEGDCMFKGMDFFFKSMLAKDLFHPVLYDVIEKTKRASKENLAHLKKMEEHATVQIESVEVESFEVKEERQEFSSVESLEEMLGEKMHPYMYTQMGSGFGHLMMTKDGYPRLVELCLAGGKFFMGVASLLTGCESYDEFIDLAEKGDNYKVDDDIFGQKKTVDGDDGDPYNMMSRFPNNSVLFHFGKTVFKKIGDFKKEDIARAWLVAIVEMFIRNMHKTALQEGVPLIMVCGSFTNRELVRRLMTEEMTRRDSRMGTYLGKQLHPQLYFLKHGGHVGAIGAMLNSIKKFTRTVTQL